MHQDIIGIANDRVRNIMDYIVFDLNSINTSIVRLYIIVTKFEFKRMMF